MSLIVWQIINGFFSSGPSQSLSAAQLQLLQQAAQAQAVQAQAAKAEAAKVLAHATAQGTAGKTVAQGKCYNDRGTDKALFGVFKQLNLWKKQLFSNEGVTKSD